MLAVLGSKTRMMDPTDGKPRSERADAGVSDAAPSEEVRERQGQFVSNMKQRTFVTSTTRVENENIHELLRFHLQVRYTFPCGSAVTPPAGRESGKSRRATPIRLSAIP